MVQVTGVAGYKTNLPCDITPPRGDNELVAMILWYQEDISHQPIFSVDARQGKLENDARNWSDPAVFGGRATMRTDTRPAELQIDPLISTDSGLYRCRVDFRNSPTKNLKINLTVIGKDL